MSVIFVVFGYLCGSVLYAQVFAKIFKKENIIKDSKDKNPGTANAFKYGGFWCGALTLLCDIAKGLLPVLLFMKTQTDFSVLSFVMAAPVLGHIFPLFNKFKGGKGIAVTFGSLLGIMPIWRPFVSLAACFIFFSVVLRITSHYHRTLATYPCALLCMMLLGEQTVVIIGFLIITSAVYVRMLTSSEEKQRTEIKLLWFNNDI